MRPEDDPESWRVRIASSIQVEGLGQEESRRVAESFASVYAACGGRRCLDDSIPLIKISVTAKEVRVQFESEEWLMEREGEPGEEADFLDQMARDAAYESGLWW